MSGLILQQAGLWPADLPLDLTAAPSGNLLPLISTAWRQSSMQAPRGPMLAALDQLVESGAALTASSAGSSGMPQPDWVGPRLAFWPDGLPERPLLAVVSSHLGRAPDLRPEWFNALRRTCTEAAKRRQTVVTVSGITTDRYLRRCPELLETKLLQVDLPRPARLPLIRWGKKILRGDRSTPGALTRRLWLSPEAEFEAAACSEPSGPLADRIVLSLADTVMVLSLQRRGRLLPLVERRVVDPRWPAASVKLALGPDLVDTETGQGLLDRGALPWTPDDSLPDRERAVDPPADRHRRSARPQTSVPARIILPPEWTVSRCLTHWTRRRAGPWPDQNEQQYLDDLILQRDGADHSAIASLRRILAERRIASSAEAIRGSTAVVCFTAVPITQLAGSRVFRPHRLRWDFEPYGVCIRKDWLEDRGVRPVIYGDDRTWAQLSEEQRPLFQLAATRGRGSQTIRWSDEQEWRHVDSLDLAFLPSDAAVVLAPTREEAESLTRLSPWPIVVVPQ